MSDASYLGWPFFEERHRQLMRELEQFAASGLGGLGHGAQDDAAIDAACREIVRRLGSARLLNHCCVVAPGERFDVRSLALSRDVLARPIVPRCWQETAMPVAESADRQCK